MNQAEAVPAARILSLRSAVPENAAVDGVRMWSVAPDDIADDDLAGARTWLNRDERHRSARFVNESLSRQYDVAHTALRLVIGTVLGQRPAEVSWSRRACPECGEPHGRPTTDGVEFSLSHTDGLALIAVAAQPVGVDVERVAAPMDGMVDALHPREATQIRAATQAEQALWFTRAWTRTEAYLKGIGIGLGRLPSLDYLGADAAPIRWVNGWQVQDIEAPVGYAASLATRLVIR